MIDFLREFFFRDVVLKLFSLTLAVLIWGTVHIAIRREVSEVPGSVNTYSRTFYDQPVTVISITTDTSGYRVQPGEVDITLQGDREPLRNLKSEHIHALVYLAEIKPGLENRGRIEVTTPPGFTHVSVVPAEVTIFPPPTNGPALRTNKLSVPTNSP